MFSLQVSEMTTHDKHLAKAAASLYRAIEDRLGNWDSDEALALFCCQCVEECIETFPSCSPDDQRAIERHVFEALDLDLSTFTT